MHSAQNNILPCMQQRPLCMRKQLHGVHADQQAQCSIFRNSLVHHCGMLLMTIRAGKGTIGLRQFDITKSAMMGHLFRETSLSKTVPRSRLTRLLSCSCALGCTCGNNNKSRLVAEGLSILADQNGSMLKMQGQKRWSLCSRS